MILPYQASPFFIIRISARSLRKKNISRDRIHYQSNNYQNIMMIEAASARNLIQDPISSTFLGQPSQYRRVAQIKKYPNKNMNTILVPVYLRAYLTQLVSVSAEEQNIKARFTLYITIPKVLPQDLITKSRLEEIRLQPELNQSKLIDFLSRNLSLQCGDQHIDIINPARSTSAQSNKMVSKRGPCQACQIVPVPSPCSLICRCKKQFVESDQERRQEIEELQEQQDDEETFNESFFVTEQSWLHGNKYVTWVIEGVFNCEYQLDNTFFPNMTINSGLKITIHDQNYQTLKIKYQFMKCLTENNMGVKIFDFKFNKHQNKKFGIYTLNLNSISCELEEVQKDLQALLVQQQLRKRAQQQHEQAFIQNQTDLNKLHSIQKTLKVAQLGFEVLSFNVPFIMRYLVSIWTLCFASIMLYFANAQSLSNIFANIILISVSEISLFSSFRMGNFKTDNPSMYQIILNICLIASLLLLIDSTDNFQKLQQEQQNNGPQPNQNAWTVFFFAAISICGVALLGNIIALLYKGLKTQKLIFNHHLERNHHLCLIWNQDIFKQFFVRGGFKKQKGQ